VKLAVQVRLVPTPEQERALAATLSTCNSAANLVSTVAFEQQVRRNFALRRLTYQELKGRGLGAQAAQHVIKKVADAYTALSAQMRDGLFGPPGSRRRAKAELKPIMFRFGTAQPFDDRNLSWAMDAQTVSIWTVHGRVKNVPFVGEPSQLKTLAAHRQGESDLLFREGKWLLSATCEVPEAVLNTEPVDWLGVDRGIVNLATTSDGRNFCGMGLTRYRRRMARVKAELQTKATKSAKRKLKARARREARHANDINHKIAKQIVADAARTGRGIALEDLQGIRARVRFPRRQRAALSTWPFHRLGTHLAYKAKRDGVPVIEVDAAYTSQMCPRCGHISRKNRPSRDDFRCLVCGLAGPADHIAALNVRDRARTAWVFVNMPHAAVSPSSSSRAVTSRKPAPKPRATEPATSVAGS
jgi:IS605 OrfB family transposase